MHRKSWSQGFRLMTCTSRSQLLVSHAKMTCELMGGPPVGIISYEKKREWPENCRMEAATHVATC